MLLMLRVDQRLAWEEVARVMAETDEPLSALELKKRAAALRQQFQRLKTRLRTLAEEDGLIHNSSDSNEGVHI